MITYLSTFISGFDKVVKELVKQNIRDAKIEFMLDGLILYKTNAQIAKIKKLRFFNNSFIVIKSFSNSKKKNTINYVVNELSRINNLNLLIKPHLTRKNKTFRIFTNKENRFVKANINSMKKIEKIIKLNYLKLNIKNPDTEFWVLERRENIGFFLLRITNNKLNKLKSGELRPELTNLLLYLSKPSIDDTFLDPFSGSGSIPIERAKIKDANLIFATDKEENYKKRFNKKIINRNLRDKIIPKTLNATNLEFFKDNFITKIVSDPPWGEFEKDINIKELYEKTLGEFNRILKPKGIMVLLVSRNINLEKMLKQFPKLKLRNKYNVLVNGKKACVYVIEKR